jgi:hypothetical protein
LLQRRKEERQARKTAEIESEGRESRKDIKQIRWTTTEATRKQSDEKDTIELALD